MSQDDALDADRAMMVATPLTPRGFTWLRPHGSKREGMSRMSTAAVMRCDTDSLKPTQARARSEYVLSSHRMPFCSQASRLSTRVGEQNPQTATYLTAIRVCWD